MGLSKKGKAKLYGVGLLLFVIVVTVILHSKYDLRTLFEAGTIESVVGMAGPFGPILFIVIMAIAVIISPLPSLPLDVAAGAVWGPYLGTLFAVIGAEIGAIIAFLLARYLGRDYIENLFKREIHICYQCSEKYLFWVILLSRLFPFFQFDIISYGAGLTNLKLRNFALASFIGMIPMTFVFTKWGQIIATGNVMLVLFFTLLVIVGLFGIPVLISKHNFLGLKDKIIIQKK